MYPACSIRLIFHLISKTLGENYKTDAPRYVMLSIYLLLTMLYA